MSDHVIRLGDCLDPVSGLASLPDKSVDHVITDPPYEAEAHTLQRQVKVFRPGDQANGWSDGRVIAKPLDFAPITEAERDGAAREFVRVSRGWVIVFCQIEGAVPWRHALEAAGAKWRRCALWVKPDAQPQLSGDRPSQAFECIALAWAGAGRSRWNGGGRSGCYTETNRSDPRRSGHPTQKPIGLIEALARDFTNPGDLVCDPFAGSGTTGVACRRLGRRFLGWERDEKYWRIAEKRIQNAREQMRMFEGAGT